MKHKILFITAAILAALLHKPVFAQNTFHGILINKSDSSVIPYAAVTLRQSGNSIITDTNGAFQFSLDRNLKELTLDIAAIGMKTSVTYTYPFNKTEKIYVDVLANSLQGVAIKSLSALQVVKKAVAAIPANYADSGYFDYSFYRRYQKVNNHYVNLFEACPAIMFRVQRDKKEIKAKESYAVRYLRRSAFHSNIMNQKEDNPADLLPLNPVYHLYESSLRPNNFPNYHFSFDTSNKNNNDYVINYFCNVSSTDTHGIGCPVALFSSMFRGEEYEIGTLVIDRETFAIKKFDRKSIRHKDYTYDYFKLNNLVRYHNQNYFEFVNGDLQVEYAQRNGKWYLDKMYRQYTNEFEEDNYNIAYSITDNFEWYSGSVSDYINEKYVNIFYPVMATAIHSYDTTFWQEDPIPFYYTTQESVYHDLQRDGPIEKQFADETKIDGYVRRKK